MDELGLRVIQLKIPITFEQMDRYVGWALATHMTKGVHLGIGDHIETIWFIVVEKMIKPIILGLAWLG